MNKRKTTKTIALGSSLAAVMACSAAVAMSTAGTTSPLRDTLRAMLTATGTPLEFPFPNLPFVTTPTEYLTSNNDFTVGSVYGNNTGQPAPENTFQGTETFTVHDTNGNDIGTVDALVSHGMTTNLPNLQVLITASHPIGDATIGTGTGQLPAPGSVFNWGGTDGSTGTPSDQNVYAGLANSHVGSIYDYGTAGPPLTGNVIHSGGFVGWGGAFGFDGPAHTDVHNALVNQDDFKLPNGDHVIAMANSPETYDAMTNTAPFATAVQGTQLFGIYTPDNELVGTFMGRTISTADLAGGHSYEILVTGDQTMADGSAGVLGSGAGQLPTDGSVFNMLYYFSPQNYSIYTDYNGTGADGANQLNGALNIFGTFFKTTWGMGNFDAVKGFTDGTNLFSAIPYADGAFIKPVAGSEIFTGINGMPNGGFSGTSTVVQGIKSFEWTDSSGHDHTFNADITTFGNGSTNDVTLYFNPQQFNYSEAAATLNGTGGLDPTADPLSYFDHGLLGGGTLPAGIDPGSILEETNHGWYSTMTSLAPDGDTTHMLDILGWGWTNVPDSSYFWDSLLFTFPTVTLPGVTEAAASAAADPAAAVAADLASSFAP